jgi:hypothetical protein
MEICHEDAHYRVALASVIAAPAFTLAANAQTNVRRDSGWSEQNNGSYKGQPLSDWYHSDSW